MPYGMPAVCVWCGKPYLAQIFEPVICEECLIAYHETGVMGGSVP